MFKPLIVDPKPKFRVRCAPGHTRVELHSQGHALQWAYDWAEAGPLGGIAWATKVHDDGTETIIRMCMRGENGIEEIGH